MMTADHAAIRARLAAANDDVGIAYSIPADEWVLTCDKPTMQALRHAPTDLRALLDENEALAAAIARVEALLEWAETDPNRPLLFNGRAPHTIHVDRLRAALDGSETC